MASGQRVEAVLAAAGLLDLAGGMAVAYTSPGTGVVTWASGELGSGLAITPSTPMYAASVTKQMVAALVAQQVLAARLHADDRVVDLLPTLPAWAQPIRVRHLIHHTSGLPATARILAAVGLDDERDLENSLVLQALGTLSFPDAPAGGAFVYSNIGYVVLAEALSALTGVALAVLAEDSLFQPLGMTTSRLAADEHPTLTGITNAPRTVGDGGLWTSADDLLLWLDALNHDRLGAALTRLVQTPGRLDDGTPLDYAWGITARPSPRGTSYTHGGGWTGWTAKTVRRPATDTAVALLTTSDDPEAVSQAAVELHELLAAL